MNTARQSQLNEDVLKGANFIVIPPLKSAGHPRITGWGPKFQGSEFIQAETMV
jgi:hypothetical protein